MFSRRMFLLGSVSTLVAVDLTVLSPFHAKRASATGAEFAAVAAVFAIASQVVGMFSGAAQKKAAALQQQAIIDLLFSISNQLIEINKGIEAILKKVDEFEEVQRKLLEEYSAKNYQARINGEFGKFIDDRRALLQRPDLWNDADYLGQYTERLKGYYDKVSTARGSLMAFAYTQNSVLLIVSVCVALRAEMDILAELQGLGIEINTIPTLDRYLSWFNENLDQESENSFATKAENLERERESATENIFRTNLILNAWQQKEPQGTYTRMHLEAIYKKRFDIDFNETVDEYHMKYVFMDISLQNIAANEQVLLVDELEDRCANSGVTMNGKSVCNGVNIPSFGEKAWEELSPQVHAFNSQAYDLAGHKHALAAMRVAKWYAEKLRNVALADPRVVVT